MQIVIDISEELKNKIDNANDDNYRTYIWWFETTLYCAIKEGIILPKGHGKLIDADELRSNAIKHKYSNNFCEEHNIDWSINLGMLNILFADAPTLIDADKEADT